MEKPYPLQVNSTHPNTAGICSVQDGKLQLFREQDNPDKFRLSLNGQNILDWFKHKYQELKQTIRPHIKPPAKPEVNKGKGFKR